MKIGILNDTHIGITHYKKLIACFQSLQKENPDVIVHAGDFNGGKNGYKHVRSTCNLMREFFPNIPIVVVLGNHDWWTKRAIPSSFVYNIAKIRDTFRRFNIHYLDEDGPFRKDGVVITGAGGWYHTRPDSNDWNYLPPHLQGDTHSYFHKRHQQVLDQNLVFTDQDLVRIYLSHFPILDCNPWDGNPRLGELFKEQFKINYFISGHSHGELNGPIHFRTATDYEEPTYKILEV